MTVSGCAAGKHPILTRARTLKFSRPRQSPTAIRTRRQSMNNPLFSTAAGVLIALLAYSTTGVAAETPMKKSSNIDRPIMIYTSAA